jgi:hypothetical protein
LLEEIVERDAWRGLLDALNQSRDARRAEAEWKRVGGEDVDSYMSVVG